MSVDSWIMANVNAKGFFMANYDQENWKKLAAQLRIDHQVDIRKYFIVLTFFTFNTDTHNTDRKFSKIEDTAKRTVPHESAAR